MERETPETISQSAPQNQGRGLLVLQLSNGAENASHRGRLRVNLGMICEEPPPTHVLSGLAFDGSREMMANLGTNPVISVIDDSCSVRAAIGSLLSSLGWSVHTFASAEDFLHSHYVNNSSCLVVDVQMPGLGGVELQRLLTGRGDSTPIIFMTAFPDDSIRTRVMKDGAVCFLSKPFDEQHLVGCLNKALSR
jgi:CheY-like chemotaxis protein